MKIKLTLKIPLKTPYKGIKLQQLERFLQKKKKRNFMGGLSFLNYNHANANNNFKLSLLLWVFGAC